VPLSLDKMAAPVDCIDWLNHFMRVRELTRAYANTSFHREIDIELIL